MYQWSEIIIIQNIRLLKGMTILSVYIEYLKKINLKIEIKDDSRKKIDLRKVYR